MNHKIRELIKVLRRNYEPKVFVIFDNYITEHIDEILQNTNLRWLIAIMDTYADYGNKEQQGKALISILLVNLVRLVETNRVVYNYDHPKSTVFDENVKMDLFGGLNIIHPHRQDALVNMSKRIIDFVDVESVLGKIWLEVLSRVKDNWIEIKLLKNVSDNPQNIFPLIVKGELKNTTWKK